METAKKEFFQDVWPEVYASRQSKKILKWPVSTIEEYSVGGEKVLCLAVLKERVKGIIPAPETGVKLDGDARLSRARLLKLLGQEIAFIVLNIDEPNGIFIASRKLALERLASQTWTNLQEGQVHPVTVRRILNNGAIVELNGIEAFLPVWEMRHGWVEEIVELFAPGDAFDVKIKVLDREKERVVVSIKDLIPNPWPDAARRYVASRINLYSGTVTGVIRSGVFVEFEPGVNALCHHYRKDPYAIGKGDVVGVEIYKVQPDKERIAGKIRRIIKKA